MHIEKQTAGDAVILALTGEFDAAAKAEILEELDELIGEATYVVFNLHGVTFINSSGLGYLLKTAKALKDAGGELVFSEVSRPFQNIVDVYGVAELFSVYESDQAALAHFN